MKENNSCDGSCECARGISRRDFLKVAAATSLLAGCSPAPQLVNPTGEPTAVPTSEPTVAPTAAPTAAPTSIPTATPTPAPTTVVTPTAVPDLTGKKVVYIIPRDTYASACHIASQDALEDCGATISLASWQLDEVVDWSGNAPPLQPDMLVSDVKAADFDAIIFECGQPLRENDPEALRIVREAVEQSKVLAAICMMPLLLAAAGVLEGKRATCNADLVTTLKSGGAIPTGATVERDGNIITASYRGHIRFGWVIAEALAG
jgi:protease I